MLHKTIFVSTVLTTQCIHQIAVLSSGMQCLLYPPKRNRVDLIKLFFCNFNFLFISLIMSFVISLHVVSKFSI